MRVMSSQYKLKKKKKLIKFVIVIGKVIPLYSSIGIVINNHDIS